MVPSVYGADPYALVSQADHFAEIGNSVKARPLYAEAEKEFRSRGDTKKELYAKFGPRSSSSCLVGHLNRERFPRLRYRCLQDRPRLGIGLRQWANERSVLTPL